jgi:hypothetical protein
MEFDLCRRLGIIVQDVEGLSTSASYIAELNLIVVRAGLSHEDRECCASYLLSELTLAPMQSRVEQ